ncbi:MAG: ABC transporter permease DevC [Kaiparowitsia implicata GSE-PSE-MK54-09C]|jgi:putative ABC transport system permease protein|nr:ABC transporter permease DevC [Kaiparowitsia implicata GSE-PSE-MK54-09C]
MQTPLALLNLVHERTRLIVAIAGVAFAVILVFMNLGFLGSLSKTASLFYQEMNADIFLISPQALEITTTKPFPIERVYQAAGVRGVERAMPLYVGYLQWRNPETRQSRAVFAFGFNLNDPLFLLPELQEPQTLATLRQPDTVLIDRLSRPEYGPLEPGTETEADRRRVVVGGQYSLGGAFAADATVIMSDQNFRRYLSPIPLTLVNLGLVKLQPDADLQAVKAALQRTLPPDVRVLTQAEIIESDRDYWIGTTSTGFIFGLGVAVSVVVGIVIVYQVLYTDITSHLKQYATLKAMGYRSRFLFSTVIQEAVILAVLGYIPGFIVALGLYELTYRATSGGLPIAMELERAITVLILTIIMCSISGLISVNKVVSADPADVFS